MTALNKCRVRDATFEAHLVTRLPDLVTWKGAQAAQKGHLATGDRSENPMGLDFGDLGQLRRGVIERRILVKKYGISVVNLKSQGPSNRGNFEIFL